jgi:hypothetical protein
MIEKQFISWKSSRCYHFSYYSNSFSPQSSTLHTSWTIMVLRIQNVLLSLMMMLATTYLLCYTSTQSDNQTFLLLSTQQPLLYSLYPRILTLFFLSPSSQSSRTSFPSLLYTAQPWLTKRISLIPYLLHLSQPHLDPNPYLENPMTLMNSLS